jgi:predicted secreted Zn-dependent protease
MRRAAFALTFLATVLPAQAADWQPIELVKHYSISGATGPELYAAIGISGPLIGNVRTIALTEWDLKWRRDYQADGLACVLKSAKPILTITTTLPKPAVNLRDPAARLWKVFIDGIAAHEKVHAADISAMTHGIIAATAGLTVQNDPQCKLIRAEVLKIVRAANEDYKDRSRAFDRAEMARGGNVQLLILGLVNGR